MNTFKIAPDDAEEIGHKLCILADEPDLLEEYGLTDEQGKALYRSVPYKGGEWSVPDWAVEAVHGELENHVDILRNISQDARSGGEMGQALRIAKLAMRIERLIEGLKK
jgi:hypothetical protein